MQNTMFRICRKSVLSHEQVIRSVPYEVSALRLVGTLLDEINEKRQWCRYVDMDELHEWTIERQQGESQSNVIDVN